MKTLIPIILALFLTACASPSQHFHHSESSGSGAGATPPTPTPEPPVRTYVELLQRLGPPTSSYPDGQGGKIYAYSQVIRTEQLTMVVSNLYYANAEGGIYLSRQTRQFR